MNPSRPSRRDLTEPERRIFDLLEPVIYQSRGALALRSGMPYPELDAIIVSLARRGYAAGDQRPGEQKGWRRAY